MHGLPLRDGSAPKIPNFARDLYEMFLLATHTVGTRRKTRSTSPNSVKRQLGYIESGSNTLLRRLKDASKDVFQAWANAADVTDYTDNHKVVYEWLQLRRLLEISAERAKRAGKTAILKADVPETRGRPSDDVAAAIAAAAANAYQELTGRDAVRSIDRDTHKPCGEFHEFLTAVFKELGIGSSPDAANMQLQSELRHLRKG
jgi:hypothetical protein